MFTSKDYMAYSFLEVLDTKMEFSQRKCEKKKRGKCMIWLEQFWEFSILH
uniref:Uncharacterized protein n=1 Tax=Rhizophora mucronata TaxID=61149 RepID=A0A2P2MUW9_RHIMU